MRNLPVILGAIAQLTSVALMLIIFFKNKLWK